MVERSPNTAGLTLGRPLRRYRLTLAYDGAGFHGWQKQHPPGQSPLRTVQQVVEDTLVRLVRQPVTVTGASRTDAGVHAEGQVGHFDAATPIPTDRLLRALNQKLPEDVEARDLAEVDLGFHAIAGARSKQYRYQLWTASRKPLGRRHRVYHCWTPLEIPRMSAAAARLVGTHEFAGFSAAGHGRQSTMRTIHRCEVWDPAPTSPEILTILVEGDGFLYNMVRIIAGTLVEVGRGKMDPGRIDRVMETGDRRLAGPTLPPSGLCLRWIQYDLDR